MKRREFIKRTGQIAVGGLITNSLAGCIRRDDIFYPSLDNGITWSNYQLSVNIASEGTNDVNGAEEPCVIKDSSTYKMWYAGLNGGIYRIIYCESSDGVNWSNFRTVINVGASGTGFDSTYANFPAVIKDGSTYRMWYAGNDGTNNRTIYCESTDGITWSNFQLAVNIGSEGTNDTNSAIGCAVIKENGTYKMWYAGNGGSWRILYCTSSDGINWSNFQLVINLSSQGTYDTNAAFWPVVIKENGSYKMWYTGNAINERTIYCTSLNRITWSNFQLSVDINSVGTFDTNLVSHPWVINDNGTGKMWYSGFDGTNFRIIYAESR